MLRDYYTKGHGKVLAWMHLFSLLNCATPSGDKAVLLF
jgi:hypothetical protein